MSKIPTDKLLELRNKVLSEDEHMEELACFLLRNVGSLISVTAVLISAQKNNSNAVLTPDEAKFAGAALHYVSGLLLGAYLEERVEGEAESN